MRRIGEVPQARWEALARSRIYFGHQSVGANILEGVQHLLSEHRNIALRVVDTLPPSAVPEGTLLHYPIGRNGDPAGKIRDFEARLSSVGDGWGGGIVLFKLCYVDFDHRTDPAALLRTYRESIERVRAAHPDLRIAHVTAPLTVRREPFKDFLRGLLGKPTYADVDALRSRYNEMIRAEYGQRDPVFDLARIEATRPDGSIQSYRYRQASVPSLVPEFTYDGAHLNEVGGRRVAEEFLVFLAATAAGSAPD